MTSVFERLEGHEQVVFCSDPDTGLRAIVALHSTALGVVAEHRAVQRIAEVSRVRRIHMPGSGSGSGRTVRQPRSSA